MSEYILKPCPFCGSEPMLGEVRPATRKSPPLFGIWCCVAQCDDGQTAITVADALQNFMRTGLIGDDFHTRTRLVGEKGV